MMPAYKLTAQETTGDWTTFWTQDPEGIAKLFRDQGRLVSSNMPICIECSQHGFNHPGPHKEEPST